MKDLGATQAGQPYWAGSRALRELGYRAPRDTYLGRRLRAAGLLTVGKASTPEFGLQSITQPLAFGPTRNPWDPSLTPGGSSGGSCAAVAAGLVPIAHANDGAGSIRIPAGWCGLVGLKPSRGRVAGRSQRDRPQLRRLRGDALACATRRCCSTRCRATSPATSTTCRRRAGPTRPSSSATRAPLRIGLLTRTPDASTHPACQAAAEDAGKLLESLGHRVELDSPPALFESERSLRSLLHGTLEYRMQLRWLAGLLGRPVARRRRRALPVDARRPGGSADPRRGLSRGSGVGAGLGHARRRLVGRGLGPAAHAHGVRAAARDRGARRARERSVGPAARAPRRTWRSPSPSA